MRISQLTTTQLRQTYVGQFVNVTDRAVVVTAAIIVYEELHNAQNMSKRLTIAHNVELLQKALVRMRNHSNFDVDAYIKRVKLLNTNSNYRWFKASIILDTGLEYDADEVFNMQMLE